MTSNKTPVLLYASLLLLLSACANNNAALLYPPDTCKTDTVTYSAVIRPIIQQNCALSGCHNTASSSGGVALENVGSVQAIARDGRLINTITHASGFSQMPKNAPKLDDCSIRKITKWVMEGSLNN